MKLLLLIPAALFSLGGWAFAQEGALASWAEPTAGGQLQEKLRQTQIGQCLPATSSTGIPVPESSRVAFVLWRGERPNCEGRGSTSSQPIDAVVLVSKDSVQDIISWYRTSLLESELNEYEVPIGKDLECTGKEPVSSTTVVFSALSVQKFCWNKHIRGAPALIIREASALWRSHGYATVIEYQKFAT